MAKHINPHPWKSQPFGKSAQPRARAAKVLPELFVEVVEIDGDKLVKRLGPYATESEAEKADRGVSINLNHDRFYTRTAR